MSDLERRRATDSTWFRVLERFGLPTLFALLLLGYVLRQGDAEARERRELLTAIRDAVTNQTIVIRELALNQARHADEVRELAAASPPRPHERNPRP